jgi:hypothetical protein
MPTLRHATKGMTGYHIIAPMLFVVRVLGTS